MKIASSWSIHPESAKAAEEAYNKLHGKLRVTPHLLLLHCSCEYDTQTVLNTLRVLSDNCPVQGGTSGLGVMTDQGFHSKNDLGLGLLGIYDPEGSYGVGISNVKDSPAEAAESAIEQALAKAGRTGELPSVVIVSNYPGNENEVIQSIEAYIGSGVPIIGGTSSDNDMSGRWLQFADNTLGRRAVSTAVLFPSCEISFAFHGGYEPTEHKGIATRVKDRILYEIDSRPAAQVYNEWTNGLISDVLPEGGSLVPTSNFTPLGNIVGTIGGVPYYRLSYPVKVIEDQAIQLFTEVEKDCELALMTGTRDSLASRAGRVAESAIDAAPFDIDDVRGALVLFCMGCMLAIKDRMNEPVEQLNAVFRGAPFLSAFTLGEQGCFLGGENRHGNLMIAVLVFGKKKSD
ncbi:MAG: FIST N-terminal domain-containing protein [Desulfobacteraceae bacterium]